MNTWMIAAGLKTDCLKKIKVKHFSGSYKKYSSEMGEKKISRRVTDHDEYVIIKLHLEGKTHIDIGSEVSLHHVTVGRIVRAYYVKNGVKPKSRNSQVKVISYKGVPDGRIFPSLTAAAEATGVNRHSIRDVANGLAETSKGYSFEWLN